MYTQVLTLVYRTLILEEYPEPNLEFLEAEGIKCVFLPCDAARWRG